jgi:hypothetical protein
MCFVCVSFCFGRNGGKQIRKYDLDEAFLVMEVLRIRIMSWPQVAKCNTITNKQTVTGVLSGYLAVLL